MLIRGKSWRGLFSAALSAQRSKSGICHRGILMLPFPPLWFTEHYLGFSCCFPPFLNLSQVHTEPVTRAGRVTKRKSPPHPRVAGFIHNSCGTTPNRLNCHNSGRCGWREQESRPLSVWNGRSWISRGGGGKRLRHVAGSSPAPSNNVSDLGFNRLSLSSLYMRVCQTRGVGRD